MLEQLDKWYHSGQSGYILLIGAAISLLTFLATKKVDDFFKKVDFKRDYYKKIIDKRMLAYAEVETTVRKLSKIHEFREHKIAYPAIFNNLSDLNNYINELNLKLNNALWLSVEMIEALQDLMNYLNDLIHEHDLLYELNEDGVSDVGHKVCKDVVQKFHEITYIIFKDIKSFHEVDAFLINKAL
jgi:hypothetical protein